MYVLCIVYITYTYIICCVFICTTCQIRKIIEKNSTESVWEREKENFFIYIYIPIKLIQYYINSVVSICQRNFSSAIVYLNSFHSILYTMFIVYIYQLSSFSVMKRHNEMNIWMNRKKLLQLLANDNSKEKISQDLWFIDFFWRSLLIVMSNMKFYFLFFFYYFNYIFLILSLIRFFSFLNRCLET